MDGVKRVVVGYTGGSEAFPTYSSIKDATEAVLIEFDPGMISYEKILDVWTKSHSPFFPQKCQYRSAIWYRNEDQKAAAEAVIAELQNKRGEGKKVYADVEPVGPFYQAEEYHQDFLNKQKAARAFRGW